MSIDTPQGETQPDTNDTRFALAWSQHGDPIDVPDGAAGWRVRRQKIGSAGGAPEVVYEAGRPLILSIEATPDELIERVGGRAGRYRLDAVDETGRILKCAPAYAVVEREAPAPPHAHDGVGEPMCPNCKLLIQTVVQLAGEMRQLATTAVTQSAPMITAASGVIIPRKPTDPPREIVVEREGAPGFDWSAFMAAAAPMLQQALMMFAQKANAGGTPSAS